MMPAFHVMIPARYQSTRLPGKLLMDLHGKTIIERVWQQACKAHPLSVTIATDNNEIAKHAMGFGAEVCMTGSHHRSGTERIAEVISRGPFNDNDIIVNVQGDEPFLPSALIQQVAGVLAGSSAQVASLFSPIQTMEEFCNPNVVKVVFNQRMEALYFSRSPIPMHRDTTESLQDCWKHIGLYAYRAGFLKQWSQSVSCSIEQHECLEQLRILWEGNSIALESASCSPVQDINTHADLIRARTVFDVV